jgi:hypothetical protein
MKSDADLAAGPRPGGQPGGPPAVSLPRSGYAAGLGKESRPEMPEARPEVLKIDGRPASRPGTTYGEFEVLVSVARRTKVLGYTIWIPKIDWETVMFTPRMRGSRSTLPQPQSYASAGRR